MKDNIKRMKRQAIDWEKIFAKDTSDKRLLSKIHKEPLKLNIVELIGVVIGLFKTTQLKNGSETLTDISPKKICR